MNQTEVRNCQNCKNQFTIEPEDFDFYKKIDVPPPTFCPDCRLQRRLLFMNERSFYRRECDLCHKITISLFPPKTPFPVYCQKCWWSDQWDPMSYGRDYDFSKPFFVQYRDFMNSVPEGEAQTMYTTLVNSDYCNIASYLKNCYLVINSDYNEDCAYSTYLERSKRSFDVYMGDYCELCYDSSNLFKCFKVFYSWNCNECIDVWFSRNLRNCSHCFGCVNLRNKQYCFWNEQLTKEEYERRFKEIGHMTDEGVRALKVRLRDFALNYPKKHAEGLNNNNVSGDYIFNSKNTHKSYEAGGCEDVKYSQFLFLYPTKDSYDLTMWGGNATRMYDCMGAGDNQNGVRFSFDCWAPGTNLEYCRHILAQCNNLFACFGLKQKEYCILNKQYTPESYKELVKSIKEHMDKMPYIDKKGRVYRYGEFPPPEISPFGYNETIAQVLMPLTKDEALAKGYNWHDEKDRDYKITKKPGDLPEKISEVSDSVVDDVIGCVHEGKCGEQCTTAFKIIPAELRFYRDMNLPLPRLCPNCRHYERVKLRNPLKLWPRQCQCAGQKSENGIYINTATHFHGDGHCPNKFETSYGPERKEIVYCEQCYNVEIV